MIRFCIALLALSAWLPTMADAQPRRHLLVPSHGKQPAPIEVVVVDDCAYGGPHCVARRPDPLVVTHVVVQRPDPIVVQPELRWPPTPSRPHLQVSAIVGARVDSGNNGIASLFGVRLGVQTPSLIEVGYRFDYTRYDSQTEYRGALELRTLFRPGRLLRPVLGFSPTIGALVDDAGTVASLGATTEFGFELHARAAHGILRIGVGVEMGAAYVPARDLARYDIGGRGSIGYEF